MNLHNIKEGNMQDHGQIINTQPIHVAEHMGCHSLGQEGVETTFADGYKIISCNECVNTGLSREYTKNPA